MDTVKTFTNVKLTEQCVLSDLYIIDCFENLAYFVCIKERHAGLTLTPDGKNPQWTCLITIFSSPLPITNHPWNSHTFPCELSGKRDYFFSLKIAGNEFCQKNNSKYNDFANRSKESSFFSGQDKTSK